MEFSPMIPGFNPMQMQPMQQMQRQGGGPSEMGLKIMQAALNQQQRQPPPVPQGGTLPGGSTNLAPVNPMQNPMQMGLLAKLLGRGAPQAPPDQGGAGPAPTALTGLW